MDIVLGSQVSVHEYVREFKYVHEIFLIGAQFGVGPGIHGNC